MLWPFLICDFWQSCNLKLLVFLMVFASQGSMQTTRGEVELLSLAALLSIPCSIENVCTQTAWLSLAKSCPSQPAPQNCWGLLLVSLVGKSVLAEYGSSWWGWLGTASGWVDASLETAKALQDAHCLVIIWNVVGGVTRWTRLTPLAFFVCLTWFVTWEALVVLKKKLLTYS